MEGDLLVRALAVLLALLVPLASYAQGAPDAGYRGSGEDPSCALGPVITTDCDNTSATEPADGSGFKIEGGSGDVTFLWENTGNDLELLLPSALESEAWPDFPSLELPQISFPLEALSDDAAPGLTWSGSIVDPPGTGMEAEFPIWLGAFRTGDASAVTNALAFSFNSDRAGSRQNTDLWGSGWTMEYSYLDGVAPNNWWAVEQYLQITRPDSNSDNYRPFFLQAGLGQDGEGYINQNYGYVRGYTQHPDVTDCTLGSCKFMNLYDWVDSQFSINRDNATSTGGANLAVYSGAKFPIWNTTTGAAATATGGTTTTLVDSDSAVALYSNMGGASVRIVAGDCKDQVRDISSVDDATGTITVDRAWLDSATYTGIEACTGGAPDSTSTYEIYPRPWQTGIASSNVPVLFSAAASMQGFRSDNYFSTSIAQAQGPTTMISGQFNNVFGGSGADRQLSRQTSGSGDGAMVAVDGTNTFSATGADNDFGNMIGLRLQNTISTNPSGFSPADIYGIQLLAPAVSGGSAPNSNTPIWIGDQLGVGATSDTIRIVAQASDDASGADGLQGNLRFTGDDWDEGHIMFGNTTTGSHIWMDANGYIRVMHGIAGSTDYPTADASGNIAVTGSGSDNSGPAIWMKPSGATNDTGTEVCALAGRGLTCVDVVDMTDGSALGAAADCSTDIADASLAVAFCK